MAGSRGRSVIVRSTPVRSTIFRSTIVELLMDKLLLYLSAQTYRLRPPGHCAPAFPKQWSGLLVGFVEDGSDRGSSRRKSYRFPPCPKDELQTSHPEQSL